MARPARSTLVSIIAALGIGIAAAEEPPPVLQITIERIKPGGESEYASIEERLAEVCARLGCPNSYLALESVAAPKEVWWLVEYAAAADVERIARAYEQNEPLLGAMRELAALKEDITEEPVAYFAEYRADSSGAWRVGREPFVAIAGVDGGAAAAAFETADGKVFAIASAATLADARDAAARLDPSARVFQVRPSWSKPDESWIRASPELWSSVQVAR